MLVVVVVSAAGLGASHAGGGAVSAAACGGERVERLRSFEVALAEGAHDVAVAPLVDAMLVEDV